MKKIVTIVIVSYNTRELTAKSIREAYKSRGFTQDEIEIIVVDNNSSDDTVSYLKKTFPKVKLIVNKQNKGFGGANNQGAKVARGKYLLLLNTDAFLGPDSLKTLVNVLEKNSDIVSVGPQLRYENGDIQLSGGYLPTPIRVMAWMWWLDKLPLIKKLFPNPYHVIDPAWHTKPQYPEWLMGACVLFRTQEFLVEGGFDEQIFMYAEEVELYRRLARTGKRVYFAPETAVIHIGGASSKKANAYRLNYELKGIEYIYKKHYPHLYWFIRFVIFVGVVKRLALFSLIPSRRETIVEYKKYFER